MTKPKYRVFGMDYPSTLSYNRFFKMTLKQYRPVMVDLFTKTRSLVERLTTPYYGHKGPVTFTGTPDWVAAQFCHYVTHPVSKADGRTS